MSFALAPILGSIGSAVSSSGIGSFFSKIGLGLRNIFNSDLFGTGYSIGKDIYNIYQQEQNNERTMNLQQQLWERDDNSLARLMKQYQDNGINPLLAVPNVTQGNTKGFETSSIQSQIQYEQERMAREQYKLNKDRQELELQIMQNQDNRAQAEHEKSVEAKGLENQLMRAKVKGAQAYAKAYGAGYGIDFGEDGYIPPYAQSIQEKAIEAIASVVENLLDGKSLDDLKPKSTTAHLPDEVKNDDSLKLHPILNPNRITYNGKNFYYQPDSGTYYYNGREYKLLQTVKNIIDYEKEQKSGISREKQYIGQWPDEYYEPMYLSQ